MYIATNIDGELLGYGASKQEAVPPTVTGTVVLYYRATPAAATLLGAGGKLADLHLNSRGAYAAPIDRIETALLTQPADVATIVAYALHQAAANLDDAYGTPEAVDYGLRPDINPAHADVLRAIQRVLGLPRRYAPIEEAIRLGGDLTPKAE
jgi:hypothetical protein